MAKPTESIDHVALARLVEAQAIRGADVVGQPGGWGIVIKYGMVERPLVARSGSLRIFKRFETLVNYLKEIGVSRYVVDASNFDHNTAKNTVVRPDASARMKRTFEAAEHDKWFREQVEEGIRQANDPNTVWVSNDEVKTISAKRRAAWTKQVKGRAA